VKFGDVNAGAKGLACTPEDDDTDGLVHLKFQKGLAQFIRKSGVKGVELLRAIQGDHPHTFSSFYDDALVRHDGPPR